MDNEYQFGESFQRKLLALYVRDPLAMYKVVEPSYFTNPIFVDIARLTKEVYSQHNLNEVKISLSVLLAVVKGFLGSKRSEVLPAYKKVVKAIFEDDLMDRLITSQQALHFALERKFREALILAEKDINGRRYPRAIERFETLKGFGTNLDLGLEYWKNPTDPRRWYEDREGVVPSHFLPTLDKLMGGGLGAGELGIVLAGGKVGKTTFLARAAAGAVMKGFTVAIASGELSDTKYRKRIDAMFTSIPSWKLSQFGRANEDRKVRKNLRRAQKRMKMAEGMTQGKLWIKQYPTGSGKVSDIDAWLENLEQSGVHIDCLYVDYVRVFKPNERHEEQRLSIGQVCVDLRGLAIKRKIPVWTASQTNRAALSKERIGPQDIAEDISQFWTLDFLVALCQTPKEEQNRPHQKARLFLSAARDVGRGGVVEVLIDRDTFRIWEPMHDKLDAAEKRIEKLEKKAKKKAKK